MTTKFFLCTRCGNVIVKVQDSGVTPFCCGSEMVELEPNAIEIVGEKHLPVVEKIDNFRIRVKVGELPHPQTKEHHIAFIYVETKDGGQLRYLDSEGVAAAEFCICMDEVTAIYSYCNIHGLWKTDVKPEADKVEKKRSCCFGKKKCCR